VHLITTSTSTPLRFFHCVVRYTEERTEPQRSRYGNEIRTASTSGDHSLAEPTVP